MKLSCCRCNKPYNKCKIIHPIDKPGANNIRWVCADCKIDFEKLMITNVIKQIEDIFLKG